MNFQNLVEYGNYFGVDLLAGVPEIETLNRDTLKSHIMFRCGLLIPLYSEPETMQAAISHWFDYMAYDINKMVSLKKTEYLPLENYRRNETENIWRHIKDDDDTSIKDEQTITDSGTITDDLDGTTTNEVSAYNEDDYSPERRQTVDQTSERTLDTERKQETERSDNRDYTRQHDENNSRLVYGNIGTMTAQDMFNQELDLLERFNPYDWIVDRIEKELFLGIW